MAKMNPVAVMGVLIDQAGKTPLLLLRSRGGCRGGAGTVPALEGTATPSSASAHPQGSGAPLESPLSLQGRPRPGRSQVSPDPKKQLIGLVLPWGDCGGAAPGPVPGLWHLCVNCRWQEEIHFQGTRRGAARMEYPLCGLGGKASGRGESWGLAPASRGAMGAWGTAGCRLQEPPLLRWTSGWRNCE